MRTRRWREIRAQKFPREKLADIDNAVLEELRILAADHRPDDLATGKINAGPADIALKRARAQSGPNRYSSQE